eukprot:586605-Pleurochrysis_carterae.AAC.1
MRPIPWLAEQALGSVVVAVHDDEQIGNVEMSWISGDCKKLGTPFKQRFTKRNYRTAMLVSLERSDESPELSIEPSSSWKDEDVLERQQDEFSSQQACNCKLGYSGLNQEHVRSNDAMQLGQNAPSRGLKRRAKLQWSADSVRRAISTCGLDDNCCNDALQAGLSQGR